MDDLKISFRYLFVFPEIQSIYYLLFIEFCLIFSHIRAIFYHEDDKSIRFYIYSLFLISLIDKYAVIW